MAIKRLIELIFLLLNHCRRSSFCHFKSSNDGKHDRNDLRKVTVSSSIWYDDNNLNHCWVISSINRAVRCQKMPNDQTSCFAVIDEQKKPQRSSHSRGGNLRIITPNRLIKSTAAIMHVIIYSVRLVSSCFYRHKLFQLNREGELSSLWISGISSQVFRCANWKCVQTEGWETRPCFVFFLRGERRLHMCWKLVWNRRLYLVEQKQTVGENTRVNVLTSEAGWSWRQTRAGRRAEQSALPPDSPRLRNTKKTFSFTHLRSVWHKKDTYYTKDVSLHLSGFISDC